MPAGVRRQQRRPVLRPGVRAGPGPVLRDGLPPPRDRRPAQRAARRGAPSRPTCTSARWAGGGWPPASTTCSTPSTRAYLDAYSDGVNAYLEGRSATQLSLEYTVLGLGGLDYEPEKWTPVDSLAWLKAMAWDLRGNMDEEIERTRLSRGPHARAGRRALPALPLRPARADRAGPATAARRAQRRGPALGPAALRGARGRTTRRRRDPRPDGQGRGHRLQQLGRLGRAHGLGQAAAGQRPAPEHLDPGHLVPDGPALPDGRRGLPVRRQRLHLLRHARAW